MDSAKGLVGRVVSYLNEPYASSNPKDLAVRLGATAAATGVIAKGAEALSELGPKADPSYLNNMYFYTHTVTAPPELMAKAAEDNTGTIAAMLAAAVLIPAAVVYVERKYGPQIKEGLAKFKEKAIGLDVKLGETFDGLVDGLRSTGKPAAYSAVTIKG